MKLTEDLVRDEGLRLKPYHDSRGIYTIGIGRNIQEVGISKEEAYHLLNNDIERVAADLDQYLPWWKDLIEPRQRVLANMCFNMGVHKLLEFRNTLALVQANKYDEAATAMLDSAWAGQVGPRAHRLAIQMREGV